MLKRKIPILTVSMIVMHIVGLPFLGDAQSKAIAHFKQGDKTFKDGDTLRVESNSTSTPSISLTIVVPKDKDSTDKKNVPGQDSLFGGKISVIVDMDNSTVDKSRVGLPLISEFSLDSLKEKKEFAYTVTVPRNSKDDGVLILQLKAKSKSGTDIKDISDKIMIYVKPLSSDSLSGGRQYELWFLTGTNFDLFDGIKAQEFFFRANMLFKISDRIWGQAAIYKNRYYTLDTASGTQQFSSVQRPNLGDSTYTLTAGNYRRSSKQTSDPIGLQIDVLGKLTNDTVSNFFVTAGLDFSTTSVTINNNYTYQDTSYYLRTSKPDTVKGYNNFGTTAFPQTFSYRKPSYNVSVGFMWILNEKEVNIKAQLTGGLSNYSNLISVYQSRGSGTIYNFEAKRNAYLQYRMFATYKPLGLSFGLESFIRATEVPAFNFTISKAFDIRGFIKNFTPVSGIIPN